MKGGPQHIPIQPKSAGVQTLIIAGMLYSAPFVTRQFVGLIQKVLDRWLLRVMSARETAPVRGRLASSEVDGQLKLVGMNLNQASDGAVDGSVRRRQVRLIANKGAVVARASLDLDHHGRLPLH